MTTVLRGPADADHYRVKVGRFGERWYVDPLPGDEIAEATTEAWPAFSTTKAAHGKDWTFVSLGRAAADFDRKREIYAGAQDREAVYTMFKAANKRGLDVATGRGTIIHWWFEDGLNDRDLRTVTDFELEANRLLPEARVEAELYRPAVASFFDTYQPTLVVAETVCVHRDLNGVGYGCTADAGMLIEGDLAAGDWKSRQPGGDHACYPEDAAQVGGAFAGAQYMIVDDDAGGARRVEVPKFDYGMIISVKPDGFRCYPVDIAKAVEHYARLHAWWVARRSETAAIGRPWAPGRTRRKAASSHSPDLAPTPVTPTGVDPDANHASGAETDGHINTVSDNQGEASSASIPDASPDRREQLLNRYHHFNDDERRAFRDLHVDPADLDAVEAGLDSVDSFANPPAKMKTPRPRRAAAESPPPNPVVPAEGTPIDAADAKVIGEHAAKLPVSAQTWISMLFAQAKKANVAFNLNTMHSLRRFELCRALITLAEWEPDVLKLDEVVRALAHAVTGVEVAQFPTTELGAVVGMLDADEAVTFAALADDLAADRRHLLVTDGVMRVAPTRLRAVT